MSTPSPSLAALAKRVAMLSRTEGRSFFESLITCTRSAGTPNAKTTAAATTGPANGPRPTSSTPATRPPRLCSLIKLGITAVCWVF